MTDERATRVRNRREESKQRARDQQSKPSKPSETDKPKETNETDQGTEPEQNATDDTDSTDGVSTSIKDEQIGTYFYLPEDQRDEIGYQYKMVSAKYEREFSEDLEKNRHFYPLVIEYGLDRLSDADAHEIRSLLESLTY